MADIRSDSRPRLLIVTTVAGMATTFLLPYIRRLRDEGWTVDVACALDSEAAVLAPEVDALLPMPWSRQVLDPRNLSVAAWRLRRVLASGHYDIVHSHAAIASFVERLVVATVPRSRRPVVVYTVHGYHFGVNPKDSLAERVYAGLERVGGRWTDCLIVINHQDRQTTLRRNIVPAERLLYLPGIGIDLQWYAANPEIEQDAAALRDGLGLRRDDCALAMLANFDPGKNHRLLVRALRRVDKRVHLLLAGDGQLRDRAARDAADYGLASRVHFLGRIRDVRPVIAASTATVLPSAREGLSRAVMESLAMGKPVIGTRIRGITDLVEPGGGILVDAGDELQLARAIDSVADDPSSAFDREQVSARLETLAIDHLVDAHLALYDKLLDRRRSSVR